MAFLPVNHTAKNTLEIIINSLSGRIFYNPMGKLLIVNSQNCDLFKNSCSLVTQIYAMQDDSSSLIKRFSDYAYGFYTSPTGKGSFVHSYAINNILVVLIALISVLNVLFKESLVCQDHLATPSMARVMVGLTNLKLVVVQITHILCPHHIKLSSKLFQVWATISAIR